MPKATETVLEINLNHLKHNYHYLRSRLAPTTKFLAVVKAFGYGSDAEKIAQTLAKLGVDYFAVAYVSEGVALREAGIQTPILVLHPQPVHFEKLIKYQLEPSLYSKKVLIDFIDTAERLQVKKHPVHIKFNTGLNRLGFSATDISFVLETVSNTKSVQVLSIFSHLAASEDAKETTFTRDQITDFQSIDTQFKQQSNFPYFRHLLNTSGVLNFPEAQFEMIRSGIGLYGFSNDTTIDAKLKPIATLKTTISQIHKIQKGETVGYNRAFKSNEAKTTATLPLGHADGIGRHYGNGKTKVLVNGQYAPIIGNVCMDMIMIDITQIACEEGDEVVIFGEGLSAETMANQAGTISYELLTGISQRVKRSYINK